MDAKKAQIPNQLIICVPKSHKQNCEIPPTTPQAIATVCSRFVLYAVMSF
jgi:hypothetical protein